MTNYKPNHRKLTIAGVERNLTNDEWSRIVYLYYPFATTTVPKTMHLISDDSNAIFNALDVSILGARVQCNNWTSIVLAHTNTLDDATPDALITIQAGNGATEFYIPDITVTKAYISAAPTLTTCQYIVLYVMTKPTGT